MNERTIHVGTRFRMVREAYGLSQQDLADKSCISRNTISNLERCNDIKLSTLLELSVRLGVAPHLWLAPDSEWLLWRHRTFGEGKGETTGKCYCACDACKYCEQLLEAY